MGRLSMVVSIWEEGIYTYLFVSCITPDLIPLTNTLSTHETMQI